MESINPSFSLKFHQELYDAVPHMMKCNITALDSKNPDVGIELDKDHEASQEDKALAGGAKSGMHCFYKEGKTRYFISTYSLEFQAFKDKIFRECQLQLILCDEHGYVLDGFARWIACQMLHLEPKYLIVGNLGDFAAKITFVRSQKLCLHNLTEEERMKIVKDEIVSHPKRAIAWTASNLGVSRTTVTKYRKELEGMGKVPVLDELETRDGRQVEHESYSPEKKKQDDAEAKTKKEGRFKSAAATRDENFVKKAKEHLKDQILEKGNPSRSFENITKFVNQLPKVYAQDKKEATEALKSLAEKLGTPLPAKTTVPISAMATWDVKTLDVKKAKSGITLKLDAAQVSDKVDVAAGVFPGEIVVGDKVITFRDHALLLLPHRAQDAVVEPSEDDLMMTGTDDFPVEADDLPDASGN